MQKVFLSTFLILSLSWPAGSAGSNLQVFTETLQLLQKYYYNPSIVSKRLTQRVVEDCQKKHFARSYEAINCLLFRIKDPYTKLLPPDEAKRELKRIKTITTGLGIVRDVLDPALVSDVQPQSPAARAGIKVHDRITAINSLPFEYLSEEEVKHYLNDSALSEKVDLDLQRGYLFYSVSLSPQELHTVPIRSKLLEGNIAYLKIDDLLTASAPNELKRLLSEKTFSNSKGLILDLRGNKGGLLSNATSITDDFLTEGLIVSTRSYQGTREIVAKPPVIYSKPIVVLIDGKTASASEIIAGALKDNHRALVVGTRSFGKGLVQQIKPLSDGAALHITVNKFYTPSGHEINRVGIEPNVYIPEPAQQLKYAQQYLKKAAFK